MLRFYVTGGQVDNEHTAKVNGTQDQQLDSLNVGGMFERGSDAIALSKERSRLALRLAGLRLVRSIYAGWRHTCLTRPTVLPAGPPPPRTGKRSAAGQSDPCPGGVINSLSLA
ncbi:hypothetical protein [Klebsiella pneumoniae]